jgi:hypothetical protein
MTTETFKNAYKQNIGTTSDTIYSVSGSGKTSVIFGAQVANKSTDDAFITLEWTDFSASSTITLGDTLLVPGNSVLEPLSGRFVLEEGDSLKVKQVGTSPNKNIDITISFIEVTI